MNSDQELQEKYSKQRYYFKCFSCSNVIIQENFKTKRSQYGNEEFRCLENILFITNIFCKNCKCLKVFENTLKEVPIDLFLEKEININLNKCEFDLIVDSLKTLQRKTSWKVEDAEYDELLKKLYSFEKK